MSNYPVDYSPNHFEENYDYFEDYHGTDIWFSESENLYFAELKREVMIDSSLDRVKGEIAKEKVEDYRDSLQSITNYFKFKELDLSDSDSMINKIMLSIKNKLDEFEQ